MSDTVESLRVELDALKAEFAAYKAEVQPLIDSHKPGERSPFPNPSGLSGMPNRYGFK